MFLITNIIFCVLLLTVHNTDPEQQIRSRATRHAARGDWVARIRVAVITLDANSVLFKIVLTYSLLFLITAHYQSKRVENIWFLVN